MLYTADSTRDSIRIQIVTPDSIRIRFERKRPIRRSLAESLSTSLFGLHSAYGRVATNQTLSPLKST